MLLTLNENVTVLQGNWKLRNKFEMLTLSTVLLCSRQNANTHTLSCEALKTNSSPADFALQQALNIYFPMFAFDCVYKYECKMNLLNQYQ